MQNFDQMLRTARAVPESSEPILAGNSIAALTLRQLVLLAARTHHPALLAGPAGAGKHVLAKAIHTASPQSGHRFLETAGDGFSIEQLSNLHEGTLYIRRFTLLPALVQHSLLEWFDDARSHRLRLIASIDSRDERLRIIEPLRKKLYRLRIPVVALAQRKEDVPVILQRLWVSSSTPDQPKFEREAWSALLEHEWPGNYRELSDFSAKCVRLFGGRDVSVEQIKQLLGLAGSRRLDCDNFNLKQHLLQEEKLYLVEALLRSNGVVDGAAEIAGLTRVTLLAKMRRHGLARI